VYPTNVRSDALSLLEDGASLNAVSRQLGISRSALREWCDQGVEPRRRSAHCFVCDCGDPADAAAYAALFGFYLGDGCISRLGRTFMLRVSCDRKHPGIIHDVSRLIESVRPGARIGQVPAPGAVVVRNYWNHWPCLFPQHGPGRKHDRALRMDAWPRAVVASSPAAFLRGLFHSDGCRVDNWTARTVAGEKKRYEYPRWQFVNHSAEIRTWCCEALDLLDIAWRQSNWKTISVSRREPVAELDRLIGPKS
jgi:hypothetical protein